MGLLSRIFGRKDEQKMTSLELFREVFAGRESSSGLNVNIDTALGVSTVFGIVRVLCDGVSQIPWRVYRDSDGGRSVASDHPANKLLYRRPNSWQTAFEFRESVMMHTVLAGNAFVFVNRIGSDRRPVELIQITGRVEVTRAKDYSLSYKVTYEDGKTQIFPQDAIWHIRGPSWNTWMGMDIVKTARDAIGLSMALEKTHANFHKNGAKVGGLLSVSDTLSNEQYAFLSKWLEGYEVGGDRHNKPMILDRGASFTPMAMTGVDAQHLETRKHQIEEICRTFRVMPIMIGQSDKAATYASAEQMFLAHVVHTLLPWYERLEQSADVNLLSEDDRESGFYTKFTPNALMRGAAKDRAEFYSKALGAGGHGTAWMTANDVRALEDMDRIDDPAADRLPAPAAAAAQTPTG